MKNLYTTIDESKVGFFESPTGTGKTLSIICGAFKWIRDYETKPIDELVNLRLANYTPKLSPKVDERAKKLEHEKYLKTLRDEPKALKRTKYDELEKETSLLIEYETKPKWKILEEELMNQNTEKIQIIYTSRTHSQISQFVQEIKKTVYADMLVTSLGSRKNLCVNENVRNLTSISKINDRCTDLQDEAHNIIDAVNTIHSTSIDMILLKLAIDQLNRYFDKYKDKLNGNSTLFIKQLQYIINNIITSYAEFQQGFLDSKMIKVNEFVDDCKIDHLNLFKILEFLENSRLSNKLQGYMEKSLQQLGQDIKGHDISKHTSPLRHIQQFLESLTANDHDGRIILSKSSIKYLLLNPSECFVDIVNEAKSVIFAGGTLSPIKEFINELVPSIEESRIHQFSCDHVIPPEQMLPIVLNAGPSGKEFKFTFENRSDKQMINEAGRAISNICNVVKGGIVVFFPSYSYLDSVVKEWKNTSVYSALQKKKKIFAESNSAEDVLGSYTRAIKLPEESKTGAVLFAVVGGKLSEGINFSDELGRVVIMIGLPYPNIKSPELVEKMKYLDSKDGISGKEYFENLCMKAVNQCIGRAIRHKNDYASVILMDTRYSSEKIQCKLPNWIRKSKVLTLSFGECISATAQVIKH
ncbi:DEAD H (Asp-Glu-Ala-Asp His) box helicase 11 [Boothiomyces macroporosus]|uniref:ATP-dependent DNA helicase CHL1 n=1 Tax=Boothiomyces macroporosus TaxID=261099 RepID=A0AAD5UEL8_9FUNG|nr:DEAD H (Asp-Glu-Ala-Asp His) box helicase 11 [Boothiomyces macroporosus]